MKKHLGKATFGGVCGFNAGVISNCELTSLTMVASGRAGGIAGFNDGEVSNCNIYSIYLTYELVDNIYDYPHCNGCIGGCVGFNRLGSVSGCYTSGTIFWDNKTDNNRDIYPSIGKVVGLNSNGGIVNKCSSDIKPILQYFYWFFIGWYDQSSHCFKVENGLIGYQES